MVNCENGLFFHNALVNIGFLLIDYAVNLSKHYEYRIYLFAANCGTAFKALGLQQIPYNFFAMQCCKTKGFYYSIRCDSKF